MEVGIKPTQRDYSLSFKLGVVDQVQKGELSYKQAQQRYGIQGRSTVLTWVRKHGRPAASWSFQGKTMTRKTDGAQHRQQARILERVRHLRLRLRQLASPICPPRLNACI